MASGYQVVGEYRYKVSDKPLGKGSFGVVYLGEHTKSGQQVAIKMLRTSEPHLFKHIDNEIRIHKELNHPNVVKCLATDERREGYTRVIYMVLEYMGGGDLESYLAKNYPRGMPENVARRFLCQIASAFQYLSSRRLSHRDLKPANMLLSDNGPEPVVKVADFGFARESDPGALMLSKVGSPLYMAPEVLMDQAYTSSADVWSTGILFLQLLSGTRPFPHATSEKDIVDTIRAGKVRPPTGVSPECAEALRAMLNPDHKKRLTWDQFLLLDYVRPMTQKNALDRSITEVGGQVNWLLTVVSFESGSSYAIPVSAAMPIINLKAILTTTLDSSKHHTHLMLLSRNHGLMIDEHTVGDYFKPPTQAKPDSPSLQAPEHAIYACWDSTWGGQMPLQKMSIPEPPQLEAGVLPLKQISAASVDSANWHSIMTVWKNSLEAHKAHAEDLQNHAAFLLQRVWTIASAVQRRGAFLALTNYLRASYAKLIARFERVSLVLKEVGPIMSVIRARIPEMIAEMRSIPLLPLCEAFPSLNLDRSATLAHLLNEAGMTKDLELLETDHINMLTGELLHSKSSDPVAAAHYKLDGAHYSGQSFSSAIAVVTPQPGIKTPALLVAMAEINNVLSDVKWGHSQRIESCSSDVAATIASTLSGLFTNFQVAVKFALETVTSALSRPPSFALTPEILTPVTNQIAAASAHYDAMMAAITALSPKLNALVETRYEFDESFASVLTRLVPLKAPFSAFEEKFNSLWSSLVLDRIAQKSRSLFRLVDFPQAYRDLLAEMERRRNWVESVQRCVKDNRAAFEALIQEETEVRDAWHAVHSNLLGRFTHVLPAQHEILAPVVPGFMKITLSESGIQTHTYPKLQAASSASSSSSTSSNSPSVAKFTAPPKPQNPTEEEYVTKNARALLSHVFQLQRDLDAMTRARAGFFHAQGTDVVPRQDYAALEAENAALKAELLQLQQKLAGRK